jgi:multicomponent Na+:H+ antiporter subunit B
MSKKDRSFRSHFKAWLAGEEMPLRERRVRTLRKRSHERPEPVPEDVRINRFIHLYHVSAVLAAVCIVAVLLYAVFHLPVFGSSNNPASNEVAQRYIEQGLEETGAVNIVSGMILDYRAFDTFGESSVLFLAIASALMLLLRDRNNIVIEEEVHETHERVIEKANEDVILKRVANVVVPCILLFGVYVVLNGHLSPGGGFSGGSIMGGGLILFAVSYGPERVKTFFGWKTFRTLVVTALLCYALSKAYVFFTGANGLENHIPLGTPGAILSAGLILLLDVCVGLIVACTMYGFYALINRGEI